MLFRSQSTSSDASSTSNPVIDLEAEEVHGLATNRSEPILVDLTNEEPSFSDDDVVIMESPRPYQPNSLFQGIKAEISEPVSNEKYVRC